MLRNVWKQFGSQGPQAKTNSPRPQRRSTDGVQRGEGAASDGSPHRSGRYSRRGSEFRDERLNAARAIRIPCSRVEQAELDPIPGHLR